MAKIIFGLTLCLLFIQLSKGAMLEGLFNEATSCEIECEQNFTSISPDFKKACSEGCRLYTVIDLAKDFRDSNKTVKLCESACSEAFINESAANACNHGCNAYPATKTSEEDIQTLHLLTPLLYMRSAYNSMAHHVKQFISTSWTVYIQEDSGKMVVLQSSPKVIESLEYSVSRGGDVSGPSPSSPSDRRKQDWIDCISHQSGIPRWLLAFVLVGFILALVWLCCGAIVSAPTQRIIPAKKKVTGAYILVCEPADDVKVPLGPPTEGSNEEAPPLPAKVSLI